MSLDKTSWSSYVLTGMLALVASWVMTGCRLGNNVESDDPATDASTTDNGYYDLKPQKVTLCVNTGTDHCVEVSPSVDPESWSQVLTDPIIFVKENESEAVLVSSVDTRYGIYIAPRPNNSFVYDATGDLIQLWNDPACLEGLKNVGAGSYSVYDSPKKKGSFNIKGKVSFYFDALRHLEGNCTQTLNDMHACYDDHSQCGEANNGDNLAMQQAVRNYFALYIDNGVMTKDDIPSIRSFLYSIDYR